MNHDVVARVLVGSALVLGCGVDAGGPGSESAEFRGLHVNGMRSNGLSPSGMKVNGMKINGLKVNGLKVDGVSLQGISLQGISLQGVSLQGSVFTGTLAGVGVSGPGFVGAQLDLDVDDEPYTLRLDDVFADPADSGGDVYFHRISVRRGDDDVWSSLCIDADGAPVEAIVIANTWDEATGARVDDPDAVTFACRGGALAECVELGYAPWRTVSPYEVGGDSISLVDLHQACTRMLRADFCGDGRSYAGADAAIDIFDALPNPLQVRATALDSAWSVEAEWGPGGATCVGELLRQRMADDLDGPGCVAALAKVDDCGALASSRPAAWIADAFCDDAEAPGQCAGES